MLHLKPRSAHHSRSVPIQLKDELKGVKEVNSDSAAAAYIEAFALRVFDNADAEDRLGVSSRYASFIIRLNLAL